MSKITLDWNEYKKTARRAIAEGCVLLENKNNVLPIKQNEKISVFGRIQNNYYKSGTGSGGLVNVSSVVSVPDGLRECGISLNEELADIYAAWEKENPCEEGIGWGGEPWSQKEMPVEDDLVRTAAENSDKAIVIIGRTAGEDRDVKNEKGSFIVTDEEYKLMKLVRKYFSGMIVLLNVGAVMDMHFVDEIAPDAVMYIWQGGMEGGLGTADVLTGKVSPSGRLTDTIAYEITDYPSDPYFGDDNVNYYTEDIFVGYRYFESFAKEKVRYPFGYGLSYTSFETKTVSVSENPEAKTVSVCLSVKNTGKCSGNEVVGIYVNPSQGTLGKAVRNLVDFGKTSELVPGEEEELSFEIPYSRFASYDAEGLTGNRSAWVLEAGIYEIYSGINVSESKCIYSFDIEKTLVLEQLEEALAPVEPFEVFTTSDGKTYSKKPAALCTKDMDEKRSERLPEDIPYTGDKGILLSDVYYGKASMDAFVAQLSDEELCALVRGEGMSSSLVTAGTASAFGGVSRALREKGIPAVCCDDGPSGMRLDSGAKAFSLPVGTMLASTFNTELVRDLYSFTGTEMLHNNVECLLGPGMNIHRHPLNGRNFEYFSEDPVVTGKMACAMVMGLQDVGVTGTIKHFCGNNQEKRRHFTDSVISERALREIYLKGFEMAVKEAKAYTIMTTYGRVNGLWTAGSYDLNTTILRKEWGFEGACMTDWWANINVRGKEADKSDFAAMVRSQNDLYMCCPNGETFGSGENTLKALGTSALSRGELQRTAENVCTAAMKSAAMKRLLKINDEIEIINRPVEAGDFDATDVEYIPMEKNLELSLEDMPAVKNSVKIIALDGRKTGIFKVTLTASSTLSELAQMSCTLLYNGFPVYVFTFHGTNGEKAEITGEAIMYNRFNVFRLNLGSSGLKLHNIKFEYDRELEPWKF